MQETYEAEQTAPSHDALASLGFAAESISMTVTFPIEVPLDLADFCTKCVSKEVVVELLQYANDSLENHETDHSERDRIEKLVRENLDDGIEVEVHVNFCPRDGNDIR